jgi:formylglycine-generating enzyme required for sulfatase activity
MKKTTAIILLTAVTAVVAAERMVVYTADGRTDYSVAHIDSVKFFNSTAPAGMKLIPARDSSFTMGVKTDAWWNEPVTQQVSFTRDFYMDSTEVTQGQYDAVMSDFTHGYARYRPPSWASGFGRGDTYPAYYVNWYDAVLYCNALSKAAGKDTVYTYSSISGTPGDDCILSQVEVNYEANGFRLPTEAEWEYAARAGSTTDYYWGKNHTHYPENESDSAEVDRYAVWRRNSYEKAHSSPDYGTHRVAGKEPNDYGLYDMSGNVWEWCGDWYGKYRKSAVVDPVGAENGSNRVLRGGSWYDFSYNLRSGYRGTYNPESENNDFGFRVVLPRVHP